jgi:hypothetical protein
MGDICENESFGEWRGN